MKATKFISSSIFSRFTCFIFWLVICPAAAGQAGQKRMLTRDQYKLWSVLVPDKISSKGNWASYRLHYEYSSTDSLFLQKTAGTRRYYYPDAIEGKFNAEFHFACVSKDTMHLRDLKTGKTQKISGVKAFDFSADHNFTAIVAKAATEKDNLEIRNRAGSIIYQVKGITAYCFDPEQKGIAFSTSENNSSQMELILYQKGIVRKKLLAEHGSSFKKLLWKEDGISFTDNSPDYSKFFYYSVSTDKLNVLDPKTTAGFPKDMDIADSFLSRQIHSKDGKKVIVWLKEKQSLSDVIDPKAVQIWNTKDRLLFEYRKFIGDLRMRDKMALWNVQENTLAKITDRELARGFLSADYRFAFIYDPIAYEPQNRQHCPYDLYAVDLADGNRTLVVRNYSMEEKPSGSPDGGYLCYAKNGHWWIYDIVKNSHANITQEIPVSFFSEDNNRPSEDKPYGIGGWTLDGQIILYDRYDLWKISLDGKTKKRLTSGREIKKSFRIKSFNSDPVYSPIESNKHALDLNGNLFLESSDKELPASGLSTWNSKSGVKEMVWENKKINQIAKASGRDVFMYLEQNFQSSPMLMIYNGRTKEIFQSNPQQKNFYWSKNIKIEYDADGVKTKGILYYPSDFREGEKYPLVVRIYERQFGYKNDYINPSLIEGDGFNIHNYTNNGYFVLLPDINYEFGNLKKSVTESVLSAVDAAVAQGSINPDKVGLIGHSFGGYETDLIITQTNRFAAAVSGAPWTDLVSAYLYTGPMFRRPDFFRAEDHQLRIGKSLYDDMQSYLKNSPVLLASQVSTPLLGWAGEEDRHVNSRHSMEFYLALRRLGKDHTLLIYPGEEHQLERHENATDLNLRIMQWFNCYLKNEKKQDWFSSPYN
ncbi:prolyl oligopeptidase family serine peptidase [Flavobacterium sp. LC2016-01]|uniref:S9 family peptidase n=1 Tax=Flavobacterium sp. LC2016-01 TaxID=2675876 RepID=UPI0012BAF77D|nr:prolyl oligopeptidase family serine peptidase [Flavobacterium sp. LC2016-01]MTH15899.1 prolyl oligopeptidase family serine peptidase [Flavobacterium sp. LC2016-01]